MSDSDRIIRRCRRVTLGDAFHRTALRCADKTALIFQQRVWTYRELDTAVSRLAGALLARGFIQGDRIAAYGRNSDAYIVLMLACMRAGLIHVPINFGLSGDELLYIVRQSGARALFHDRLGRDNVAAIAARASLESLGSLDNPDGALDVLTLAQGEGDGSPPEVDIDGEDLAQIIYTSGTTSLPKGAMMSHNALLANHRTAIHYFEFSEQTRGISALPFYHAVMHVNCLPYLLAGATQIVLERPEPGLVLELLERERINSLFAPPTVLIKLLRDPDFDRRDLSRLTHILYGASIMPAATVAELKRRLPQAGLYNIYGQTEIGPIATILLPHEHEQRPTSAGRPVLNTQTRIVDADMNEVPVGERGEIVHRAPTLLQGYWEKPDETAAVFEGGWFHSGDMGYRDAEGYLYVVDRIKDVINTGGVLVSSREVEECLYKHEAVAEVAVIGLSHPKWVEAIAAIVVLKTEAVTDEQTLLNYTRQHLAHFKIPKRVVFAATLPTNPSGKILKRELRETHAELFAVDFD